MNHIVPDLCHEVISSRREPVEFFQLLSAACEMRHPGI